MSAIIQSETPATTQGETPETVPKELSEHAYIFRINMTCGGCSGAVNRVLSKLEGVKSHDVTINKSPVDPGYAIVKTEPFLDLNTVYEKIKKTGKKVYRVDADGVQTEYEKMPSKAGGDGVKTEPEKLPEQIAA